MNNEKLEKFQDEIRDFIKSRSTQEGLKIHHYDMFMVTEYGDAYASTSGKLNSINDFSDNASQSDHIAMYDVVATGYKAYKCIAMKALVTLIFNYKEAFSKGELVEILATLNNLLDGIDMDSSLVDILSKFNGTPSKEEVRDTILAAIKSFKN